MKSIHIFLDFEIDKLLHRSSSKTAVLFSLNCVDVCCGVKQEEAGVWFMVCKRLKMDAGTSEVRNTCVWVLLNGQFVKQATVS